MAIRLCRTCNQPVDVSDIYDSFYVELSVGKLQSYIPEQFSFGPAKDRRHKYTCNTETVGAAREGLFSYRCYDYSKNMSDGYLCTDIHERASVISVLNKLTKEVE